jgi:hypothetical protein
MVGRCLGDDIDRAADGVAAIKRPCGPRRTSIRSMSFIAPNEPTSGHNRHHRQRPHRAFRARIERAGADAANIKLRADRAKAAEIEIGHFGGDVVDADNAGLGDLFAADRGDRDRNGLRAFLAALRGDDDVGNARRGFGGLRLGGIRFVSAAWALAPA